MTALEGMKEHVDGPFRDVARAEAVRQVVMMETLTKAQTVIQEQVGNLAARDEEIRQLQHQLEVSKILNVAYKHTFTTLCDSAIVYLAWTTGYSMS